MAAPHHGPTQDQNDQIHVQTTEGPSLGSFLMTEEARPVKAVSEKQGEGKPVGVDVVAETGQGGAAEKKKEKKKKEKERRNDSGFKTTLYGWPLYMVQLSLCLALLLGALDSSIVSTALVTIGRDFNDFIRLQWIVLAYLLTYLGFAFIASRISDVIGRKWASILAVAILTASSLGAGLSQTLTQLIVFRALQGIGGSGVYSIPFTVLPEITPPDKFPLLSGITGLTFVCSSILGPTLGGIITTQSSWRWIFLFNVPVGIFIIALMLLTWPRQEHHADSGKISWRQLDWIGCVLCIAASVLLIFALQEAGSGTYRWSSPIIIVSFTISALAFVALGLWIWYLSSAERMFAPLFPARIVTHRIILLVVVASAFVGYVMFTVLVELPQRFQVVNGRSSQAAGILLLPLLGSSAASTGIGGFLSKGRGDRAFLIISGGAGFVVLGSALLSTIPFARHIPKSLYAYEVLLGLGLGATLMSTVMVIKLHASQEDAASAQGLQSQTRILGANIGLSIATVILNSQLTTKLRGTLTPQQIHDLQRSLNAIQGFSPKEVLAVAETFSDAFRLQMRGCAIVSGLLVICCLATYMTNPPSLESLTAAAKAKEREREAEAQQQQQGQTQVGKGGGEQVVQQV